MLEPEITISTPTADLGKRRRHARIADSAVRFTLLAAMIGNQRLEHSGEPRGKSFGSDTLGGNAGALA
jgi:hypothetical protein